MKLAGPVPPRVLVALSGGVDSMCLTHLLSQRTKVHALTIDHRYRPDLHIEAGQVGQVVQKWNVSHNIYTLDKLSVSNFEEAARDLRYEALRSECVRLGIDTIFVGHTLSDRFETFLQRLHNNSTVFGLSALSRVSPLPLPPKSPDEHIKISRPLLNYEKAQLVEYCKKHGIPWFEDPTNSDQQLTQRNWLRYIIDEYAPSHKIEELSKDRLKSSLSQVDEYVLRVNERVDALDKRINKTVDPQTLEINFDLPKIDDEVVFSRWLFRTLSSISGAETHYSYAKIERRLLPRIMAFIDGDEHRFKVNYLKCTIEVKKRGALFFTLKRQPYSQEEIARSRISYSGGWVLFDKTWWIEVGCPATIEAYAGQLPHYPAVNVPFVHGPHFRCLPTLGVFEGQCPRVTCTPRKC